MSRKIDDLSKPMVAKAIQLLGMLQERGIQHTIVETRRSEETQRAYYAQGRESLERVNQLRQVAGLWAISQPDNRIITRTMQSRHLIGEAIDIVPLDAQGKAWWNAPKEVWESIGECSEACGLEWGGRWEATDDKLGWDCPHHQLRR